MMDRPELRRFISISMAGYALMGWAYLSIIMRGQNPVTEDLFGQHVYAIPGWFWATMQGLGGTISVVGALIGKRRGWWMILVGSSMLVIEFGLFAALAGDGSQGEIVALGSGFISLPMAATCTYYAARRLRHGGA